jgi:hypothetical protein
MYYIYIYIYTHIYLYISTLNSILCLLHFALKNEMLAGYLLLLFLFGLNRPPLWSSGESSWLQIQRSGFNFRSYKIFIEVVGLERGQLSLVRIIEELLERLRSGKPILRAVGIRCADHARPSIRKSCH